MRSHDEPTGAYFDCNATTPTMPEASAAAVLAMGKLYGNPSSLHLAGLQAKAILESTRATAARVLGCASDRIIFTSGATEAIQTAIVSVLQATRTNVEERCVKLLYSATEHKAVPEALHHWARALGIACEIVELPVDERGLLKLDSLRAHLPDAVLLCTMAVNNETGVIQDLAAIERVLEETKSNAFWLVDCVQALGKLALALDETRIDYAPFSGHKLYAPKGVGMLYARAGVPLVPLIVGGGQERGLRSGTENLPGVAALGAVLDRLEARSHGDDRAIDWQSSEQLAAFRDRLVGTLRMAFPKVVFNTPFDGAVPTTINFSIPGFTSLELIDLFDSAGVRMSAGSACSSASAKPSHVLDAMGLEGWRSLSALRLSFGPRTSEAEIERGCRALLDAAMALQGSCLLDAPGGFQPPVHLRDGIVQLRAGSTNSWLITHAASRTCVVIDPTDALAERIVHYIRCQDLGVAAILDTHSHADHESIRPELQAILADKLLEPSGTRDPLGWPSEHTKPLLLDDGSKVDALSMGGGRVLARLATPGHTLDSKVFLLGTPVGDRLPKEHVRFAFCGDTILSGGLGRTNFSISDVEALFTSLGNLHRALAPMTLLCPAHDYTNSFATSLETETRENALLALARKFGDREALGQFMSKKRDIDKDLARLESEFQGMVCGVFNDATMKALGETSMTLGELRRRCREGERRPLLIDVREPQEVSLFTDWASLELGDVGTPRNVPLSRFVNFMGELAAEHDAARELVLICRSGTRSLHAARTLRRLGLGHASSLKSGVAPVPA
ncbi:MAG: aminotransferase class V-fold PLP-dependent enzyme [Polyangiales bacterium]